jgi:prephenate dehydratase
MTGDLSDPADLLAFQGVPGAYSHLACREVFPELAPYPCATFADAFAALQEGRVDRALIPIENSMAGRVADIHALLPDSGLSIVGEHFLRVRHHLLAPKGASLGSLKRVYSHIQALSQCRQYLRDNGLEAIEVADTAGAAKDVAARGNPEEAAIASGLAGEIYGLDSLQAGIEDQLGNTTRFVALTRHRQDPDPLAGGPFMTSILFQVGSQPSALYKALGGFATNGVNVVKLESYLIETFTIAQFYVEIEGHPADRAVDRALDELRHFTIKMKVLGAYEAHPHRREKR